MVDVEFILSSFVLAVVARSRVEMLRSREVVAPWYQPATVVLMSRYDHQCAVTDRPTTCLVRIITNSTTTALS